MPLLYDGLNIMFDEYTSKRVQLLVREEQEVLEMSLKGVKLRSEFYSLKGAVEELFRLSSLGCLSVQLKVGESGYISLSDIERFVLSDEKIPIHPSLL